MCDKLTRDDLITIWIVLNNEVDRWKRYREADKLREVDQEKWLQNSNEQIARFDKVLTKVNEILDATRS